MVGNICTNCANLVANGTIGKEIGANGKNGNIIGTNGKNGNTIGTNGTNVTNQWYHWENPEHTQFVYSNTLEKKFQELFRVGIVSPLQWSRSRSLIIIENFFSTVQYSTVQYSTV